MQADYLHPHWKMVIGCAVESTYQTADNGIFIQFE